MSSFTLKILALVTMAIDHTGATLFPQAWPLRLIGRLAFPIYCFLLAEGFFYTSSRRRYFFRLALWGVLSEPCFDLAFYGSLWNFSHQNVFWTLLAGLGAMWVLEALKDKPLMGIGTAACIALAAEFLHTDYGAFGVLVILIFYGLRGQKEASLTVFALVNSGYGILQSFTQLAAIFACVPLWFYNGQRGPRLPKLLFYGFYPLHLLALWGLRMVL